MKKNSGKFAFAYILYGGTETFFHLLTSVRSLARTNPQIERVLLYRNSVPEWQRAILEKYFTKLLKINPFPVGKALFSERAESRHYGVFDKLYCWGLEEYEKVILLEADTLVLRKIVHLFYVPAPATHIPIPEYSWKTGAKLTMGIRLRNPLNCGCLVIKPSIDILNGLVRDIEQLESQKKSYVRPEATLIFNHFAEKWHSLGMKYNFHPRFFSRGEKRVHHNKYLRHVKIKDISILHCHGQQKPLVALVDAERYKAQNKIEREFVDTLQMMKANNVEVIARDIENARTNKEKFDSLMMFWLRQHRDSVDTHRIEICQDSKNFAAVA